MILAACGSRHHRRNRHRRNRRNATPTQRDKAAFSPKIVRVAKGKGYVQPQQVGEGQELDFEREFLGDPPSPTLAR